MGIVSSPQQKSEEQLIAAQEAIKSKRDKAPFLSVYCGYRQSVKHSMTSAGFEALELQTHAAVFGNGYFITKPLGKHGAIYNGTKQSDSEWAKKDRVFRHNEFLTELIMAEIITVQVAEAVKRGEKSLHLDLKLVSEEDIKKLHFLKTLLYHKVYKIVLREIKTIKK